MSTDNNNTQNQKNINEVFKENFDKYFHEVEKVMPQYLQSMTKLQEEFLSAWKNTIKDSIDFQKEFTKNTDIDTNIPHYAADIIYSMMEEYIKSKNIQNKVILSALDSTNTNFKNTKNAFEPFTELNKNVLNYWSSFYFKKNK